MAPDGSVTRMRTRPDCAIKGEIAVKKAPIKIARRLRGSEAIRLLETRKHARTCV